MTSEPTPVFQPRRAVSAGVVLLLAAVVILLLGTFGAHPGLSPFHFAELGLAAGFAGILLLVIGV